MFYDHVGASELFGKCSFDCVAYLLYLNEMMEYDAVSSPILMQHYFLFLFCWTDAGLDTDSLLPLTV